MRGVAKDGGVVGAHCGELLVKLAERFFGLVRGEPPGGVEDSGVALSACQLIDLIFERHPRKKVRDSLFDREARVAIVGSGLLRRSCDGESACDSQNLKPADGLRRHDLGPIVADRTV